MGDEPTGNLDKKNSDMVFDIFNKHKDKIDRVTLWGMHDGMSWKNDYPIPNRTNYPLLWDRNLKPKKALETLLKNR